MKLISAFVLAIRIVQSLYYINPKFQAFSHLLWLYSPVCVGPGRKPRRPVFSQRGSFSASSRVAINLDHSIILHGHLLIAIANYNCTWSFQTRIFDKNITLEGPVTGQLLNPVICIVRQEHVTYLIDTDTLRMLQFFFFKLKT